MSTVRESSDCCIKSKFSSAQKGYFDDEYLSIFVDKLHPRSSLINRGYYIRFGVIDEVLQSWWSSVNSLNYQKFQIISLGAGYDPSYFRLKSIGKLPPACHYVEIDFPKVMRRKYELIKDKVFSSNPVPLQQAASIVLHTAEYSMLAADLTDVPALEKCFSSIGITFESPTLFLSECSITYITPEKCDNFIRWIQSVFANSVFVTYEQVYPFDAFGLVMQNHFIQVGSPLKSITKYPNEESQCKRFKNLGWSTCSAISLYDFFISLPVEEKRRIQELEVFDEYEMWHEKCHHYILVWASQGALVKCLHSLEIKRPAVDMAQYTVSPKTFKWNYIVAHETVQRYGHQLILISASVILITGGFGRANKKHKRLGDVIAYNIKSKSSAPVLDEDEKHFLGQRMFHTMTVLSNNAVVIIGGRSSPKKIFDEVLVLQMSTTKREDDFPEYFSQLKTSMPIPTWRHSVSLLEIQDSESIFVFGGLSEKSIAVNNCFILNCETWKWSTVEHSPCPRHSHSAVPYKRNSVIVTGGLAQDETILSSVHLFRSDTMEWSILNVVGLLPRYSHTSHIWKDYLFLVGGITAVTNCKLGVGVMDLKSMQAFEVALPAQDPEFPVMLCNHSSYIEGDDILIVGGGGNCFSFGTHFNERIVSFDVKELVTS